MPISKETQKEHARYLYFTTALTQKQIAEAVDVVPKTISRWIAESNWEEHKKITYFSPDQETQYLYDELREIDNNIRKREPGLRFGTKEELEAKAKILNLIMGPLKNTADKWRNITPQYVVEEPKVLEGKEERHRGFDIIIEGIDPKGQNWSNPDFGRSRDI